MTDSPPFPETHWTLLEREGTTEAGRAWFCETYRPAVLGYLRARCGADEAEDICQEFFSVVVLGRDIAARADRHRGSLRGLLQTALTRFLSNHRRAARAGRRGHGVPPVALDDHPSTAPFLADPDAPRPDEAFDRAWAAHLLHRAILAAEQQCAQRNKSALFAALRPALEGSALPRSHAEIAAELGIKVRDVTLGLSRLRQMVGRLLFEEVTQTVAGARDVDDEWKSIRLALESA